MNYRIVIMFLTVIILAATAGTSHGQSVSIMVRDSKGAELAGATVQLVRDSDQTRYGLTTNLKGIARFENVAAGQYTAIITFIGLQPLEEAVRVSTGHNEFTYQMSEDAVMMKEVVVMVSRPLMRQEEDKMIIDIQGLANISTNTLEILESTPGLIVDQEGGIFLSSTSSAMIFINGREQKMSTQDIMTILRSLPPGSVQRIEVIRTPSAKYSASSTGGIVNVVLKKGVKIGRFGSLRTGMNQGVYGNRFAGVSLNESGDLSTSYLNFEYSRNEILENLTSTRLLKPDTSLFQAAETHRKASQGFFGYGISYDASEKLNLGYDGRINRSVPSSSATNTNTVRTIEEIVITETVNKTENNSGFLSIRQDLGALYRIDSIGSELDTRLSYTFNNNSNVQDYRIDQPVSSLPGITGNGESAQRRHFLQIQSDLTCHLPYSIRMEAGLNSTWQQYGSSSEYFIMRESTLSDDPSRTSSYSYRENINSGYIQASRDLGWQVLLKTGLRMEHTSMKGMQIIPSDTSFVINRADWFPYVYLSRPVFSLGGFELRAYAIYRKTISRPGYESLNPSVRYIDQFFYETGNPGLKPQFTNNIEVNVSIDDMPLFAYGRSYTRDIFSSVIYQDNRDPNVAVRTYDNLGAGRETYFRATGGIPPSKVYFFYVGAQYNLNEYSGVYETESFEYSRGSWRFFTYHSLRLNTGTRITLNGFLMTRGQMNFYELENYGQLNISLNQTFFDRKLAITLSARDVLRTMVTNFRLNQGSISSYGSRYSDSRRFGINILYNFGIPAKKEKEKSFGFDMSE
jgi:hypothetical protein